MKDRPRRQDERQARPILVTGATGNTGRLVVRALLARGARVRVATRAQDASSPRQLEDAHERVALDLCDRATFALALRGCAAAFVLRPPALADMEATLHPFIDEALRQGLEQLVFLSVAGAERNALVPHHKVERHLARVAPGRFTLLRPGFFAQNLEDAYLRDLREDHRLYVPAGAGRVAFVDLEDVAQVAAAALLEPQAHAGRAYTLTGPQALSFAQVAQLLSQALGRPIRYEAASVAGYLSHLRRRRGLPWGQALVQTILHVGLRFGQAEQVDDTLPRLLGRPARTLEQYIQGDVTRWADAPPP